MAKRVWYAVLFVIVFVLGAEALPQDWPCGAIEVAEVSRATDFGGLVRLQYAGEKDGVRMRVECFAVEDNPDKADLAAGGSV